MARRRRRASTPQHLEAAQKKYDELKQPYDELVEQRDAIRNEQQRLYEDAVAARRDYENARKNASKENTKVSDDEGYLNQRLSMDWDWLRSFSGVSPFGLTWSLSFP